MVIFSQIGCLAHAVDDLIKSHLQLWGGQNCDTLAVDDVNRIHLYTGVDEIVTRLRLMPLTCWLIPLGVDDPCG